MNQNKIIIFSLIALIIMGLGWIIYFLTSGKTPSVQTPTPTDSTYYLATVSTVDQTIFAKVQIGDSVTNLDKDTLSKYLKLSFSSTYETLWMMCADGYTLKNPASPTNNSISLEQGVGASMSIDKDKTNTATFICSK